MTHLERYFGREVVQSLAPDELQAMATAQIEGSVVNGRLQELLDQHPSDITRILKQLCTKGLLESDNRRRWATYRLAGPAKELPSSSLHLGGSSLQSGPNSLQTDRSSPQTGGSLPQSEGVFPADGDGPRSIDLAGIREIIGKRKRLPKRETEQIILQLCAKDFFKAQDLAKLLNRSQVGLQNRFLTPMVQQKLLQMKYPEVINHPRQAYRTVALGTDLSTETPS